MFVDRKSKEELVFSIKMAQVILKEFTTIVMKKHRIKEKNKAMVFGNLLLILGMIRKAVIVKEIRRKLIPAQLLSINTLPSLKKYPLPFLKSKL